MRRLGDSYWQLYRAVIRLGETFDHKTLLSWIQGERAPRSIASFEILARIERRRLAWHLSDDFGSLPFSKREEILDWVRRVIISGSTDYRRYQAAARM